MHKTAATSSGVAPFAIEQGMVPVEGNETPVRIYMENTGQIAQARVQTPDGQVSYAGGNMIDGVPNPAAPIPIAFSDTADPVAVRYSPRATKRMSLMGYRDHDRQRHALRVDCST